MRAAGVPHPLDSAAMSLLSAEERIALGARATPLEFHAEIERLVALSERRARLRPAFRYAPAPDLGSVRRALAAVVQSAPAFGRLGRLVARRAEELELEARLAERVGSPGFATLANERFRAPTGSLEERVASFVAAAFAAHAPDQGVVALTASDDALSPASLLNRLVRRAAELALPIRIEVRKQQLAVAATGRGIVAIRPNVMLTAASVERIASHELLAHALPRLRSERASFALLRAGTAGSVEAEEGRAVLVEERTGTLDVARRRELALRHVAAVALRSGAEFHDTVSELVARGAGQRAAIEIAVRVHRGGGLGRELVYLPAYCEVRAAFAREPELERWFDRGRVGIEAARELHANGDGYGASADYSSNSTSTGA